MTGTITDATSKGVLPRINVHVTAANTDLSTRSDDAGRFTVEGIPRGSVDVTLFAESYDTQTRTVEITDNIRLDFVLVRAVPATPPPSAAGGSTGIRFDSIRIPHEWIVGSPVPTNNIAATYSGWPLPVRNSGSFIFRLSDFPRNVLPSGGTGNVLSPSEVVIAAVKLSPSSSTSGSVSFEWHKVAAADTVVFRSDDGIPPANPADPLWWAAVWSVIGHYGWEISEPGAYYLVVNTTWGNARLDFLVQP